MKATGILRRIDSLGRIVIPKEIRKNFRIRDGESLEIYVEGEDKIVLRKYFPMNKLVDFSQKYIDSAYSSIKENILVTDTDKIIAFSGKYKKKYINKEISKYLIDQIERRVNLNERHKKDLVLTNEYKENSYYSISSILNNGDCIGLVIIFSIDRNLTENEEKMTKIMADFLSKNVEI